MLARLLRILIVVQVLCGAGLGYLLVRWAGRPDWCIPALAVLFPLATMLLVDLVSAWRARSGESVRLWWRALAGEFMAGLRIFLLRQPWTVQPPGVLPATGTRARVPVVLVQETVFNAEALGWTAVMTVLGCGLMRRGAQGRVLRGAASVNSENTAAGAPRLTL